MQLCHRKFTAFGSFETISCKHKGPPVPDGPETPSVPVRSALHVPPQKGGNGLSQLVFRVTGDQAWGGAHKQDQPQQVALRQNGGGHVDRQLVAPVGDGDGLAFTGVLVDAAALHDLLQLRRDALALELPLAAAGHGDDRVPVRDGADAAGGAAHGLAELPGKVLHSAQQGVFFEDDFSIPAGVDLQRITFPDPHGAANLLGNHDPAKVVPLCQERDKKINDFFKKPGAAWFLSFLKR